MELALSLVLPMAAICLLHGLWLTLLAISPYLLSPLVLVH